MNKFLKFLQGNTAVLLGAIAALSTQLWHSVSAFVALEVGGSQHYLNYFFGILFAFSTSFAILLFTVRGRRGLAYFSLAVEVFVNLIHYSVLDMPVGALLFSTLFMCAIVPVFIAVYSSEIVPERDDVVESQSTVPAHAVPALQQTEKMTDREFLDEVNRIAGFDITNREDKSGGLPEEKREELRKLWRQRGQMSKDQLLSNINSVLRTRGNPLFT